MLWTTRTKAVALDAAMYSFLWPWGHPIAGVVVLFVALLGAIRALWTMPRALALLCVGYVPYAVFHLLFQETITVRYALPLVLPVAYLVICALDWGDGTAASVGTVAVALWSLFLSVPATFAYGHESSPAFRALNEAARSAPTQQGRVIGMHAVSRRAADWLQSFGGLTARRVLKAPHGQEWLTLVAQWRAEPSTSIAFVADPRRTDLVLIDPAARRPPLPFRWGFSEPPFVGGTRPGDSDLYALSPPGWMLDRGWALTAEVAGVTARDGLGPHKKPSIAWVRSRAGRSDTACRRSASRCSQRPTGRDQRCRGMAILSIVSRRNPDSFCVGLRCLRGSLAAGSGYIPIEVSSHPVGNGRLPVSR